ncbi:MAG: class I SAM-dependent methyltransferase [Betaproteobacteria bacterium]
MNCTPLAPGNAVIFGAAAVRYAQARPRYPAAFFDWLCAQVPGHECAWDVGCGSGQATTALSAGFAKVIANDIDAQQLAQAPPLPNVQWINAPAEDTALAADSVDLALAASAIHWLDLDVFYPRLRRALRPGGVFVAVAYATTEVAAPLKAAIKEAFSPLAPYWSEGNRRIWRGYADLPFPFDVIEAPVFAIELEWSIDEYLAFASTWSAALLYRQATGLDVAVAARDRLAPLWGEGRQRIVMPLTMKAGRKR